MKHGEFRLVKQVKNVGCFAEVSLSISRCPSIEGCVVKWDDKCDRKYKEAVEFGVAYAWEGMPAKEIGRLGIVVAIEHVGWAAVDTSSVYVAYATINAFWEAMGYKPDWRVPALDMEKMGVFFPR